MFELDHILKKIIHLLLIEFVFLPDISILWFCDMFNEWQF